MKIIYLLLFLLPLSAVANLQELFKPHSTPKEWSVESISISKGEPNLELGDYILVAKYRNISKRSIKVATNHVNGCCHPPIYKVIAPNESCVISLRESSKHEGKRLKVVAGYGSDAVIFGSYDLKLIKKDNKLQQTNR